MRGIINRKKRYISNFENTRLTGENQLSHPDYDAKQCSCVLEIHKKENFETAHKYFGIT